MLDIARMRREAAALAKMRRTNRFIKLESIIKDLSERYPRADPGTVQAVARWAWTRETSGTADPGAELDVLALEHADAHGLAYGESLRAVQRANRVLAERVAARLRQ
jgi:hypothetical protein